MLLLDLPDLLVEQSLSLLPATSLARVMQVSHWCSQRARGGINMASTGRFTTPLELFMHQLCTLNGMLRIRMRPVLTATDLASYEAMHQIRLPVVYRAFLATVGNGEVGRPDSFTYDLKPLEPVIRGFATALDRPIAPCLEIMHHGCTIWSFLRLAGPLAGYVDPEMSFQDGEGESDEEPISFLKWHLDRTIRMIKERVVASLNGFQSDGEAMAEQADDAAREAVDDATLTTAFRLAQALRDSLPADRVYHSAMSSEVLFRSMATLLKGDEDTYHRVCTLANLLSSHDNPYVNSSALMNSLCEEDSDLKLAFEAILPIYAGDDLRAGRLHKQIMRDARDEKQFTMANGEVRTMRQLLQRQQG